MTALELISRTATRARDAAYMVALKSISRRILRLDRANVSLISQPHLEFFSGKNFVKPNASTPFVLRLS
jgi:hypothetical protein